MTIRPAQPRGARPAPKPATPTAPVSSNSSTIGAPASASTPKPGPSPATTPLDNATHAAVHFGSGRAGSLSANELARGLETYSYESARTFASIGLSQRLLDEGRAEVSVIWQGEPMRMFAIEVTDDTISLTPHADPDRARQALSYLPLVKDAEYEFTGNGGVKDVSYVLRTHQFGFVKWQYMAQRSIDGGPESLARDFLCLGAFQKGADGVLFLEANSLAELNRKKPGPRQVLLKLPPREGWTTRLSYNGGASTYRLRVEGFESITVPAGRFDNCARIRVEPEQGIEPARTFWLATGVGLVMVKSDDGRGMELAKYRFP